MKSGRSKAFFFSLLFFFAVSFAAGVAAEESGAGQYSSQLAEIKTRLETIEKKQQEILSQKEKILEELASLRVWVRHNGGSAQP
ncbi:MAG TPA: hypothetical protein PLL75_06395 [Candidatus Omnitrophota bacterium]|nr:hypothetical protein [Candidatus Omnitrophota bacterium]HPS37338.1 hypothetical protein [Candidatus Omnitrophota bacterium]